jgi:hypothetical protein
VPDLTSHKEASLLKLPLDLIRKRALVNVHTAPTNWRMSDDL